MVIFEMNRFYRMSRGLIAALMLFGLPSPASAQEDTPSILEAGYSIDDDAIASFFDQYGGVNTFGLPISREFVLFGKSVQLFQNAVLQVQPDGSVQAVQLTAPGLLPYTSFDGLTVPAEDPGTGFVAPTPDQPNYSARLQVFVQTIVPDQILSSYTRTGGIAVWGLPTSRSHADPNNPNFAYQRFQNGILFYDANSGTTRPLPMGEYLKAILTGDNLSTDIAREAAASSLLRQYAPSRINGLARPDVLVETNLGSAFEPD